MASESEYALGHTVDCVNCQWRDKWSYSHKGVAKWDKCSIARHKHIKEMGRSNYIKSIIESPDSYSVNPLDCDKRYVRDRIKNNRMWVHLYFKGREKDWVVIEPNKHEILVQASWWVRKLFGVADRFHQWQDARALKRAEKLVEKRKTVLLTHIVKELPRA